MNKMNKLFITMLAGWTAVLVVDFVIEKHYSFYSLYSSLTGKHFDDYADPLRCLFPLRTSVE